MKGMLGNLPPCQNAPAISSITKKGETITTCAGGGWQVEYYINLSGSGLTARQELYVEHATNAAGDNWAAFGNYGSEGDTQVTVTRDDGTIGTDDQGNGTATVYHRIRAWVIPLDDTDETNACSGPTTYGTVETDTDYSCFA
jgi:hypothetical protein